MDKKSFILYIDRKKEIDLLSDAQCGVLLKAIFEYAETGIMPEIHDLAVKILLSVFITQMDESSKKWEEAKSKRSEAGKKGMSSRWSGKPKKAITNDNNVIGVITNDNKAKQAITKITVTDTVTGTVTGILPVTGVTGNIEQDCPAPVRAEQPAPGEENVIPWEEIDPDLYHWAD